MNPELTLDKPVPENLALSLDVSVERIHPRPALEELSERNLIDQTGDELQVGTRKSWDSGLDDTERFGDPVTKRKGAEISFRARKVWEGGERTNRIAGLRNL